MINKRFGLTLLTALGLSTAAFAAEPAPQIGIVNFATCVTESQSGKQEQASFEGLKKQMGTLLDDTEKQLSEIATTLNDPEKLDALSPEAEQELKGKYQTLSEEMGRYQNQYYQVLNQANMRLIQTMSAAINSASEKVAKQKKLAMILNKEACFFYSPALEVTPFVIAEMDKTFQENTKKQEAPAATNSEAGKK